MPSAPRSPLRYYIMEAVGLMGFVLVADIARIFMEHPDLPPMQSLLGDEKWAMLRRLPVGIALFGYAVLVGKLFGKKSGAHLTPAFTWSYFRLRRISLRNAVGYTIAQFAGAFAGVGLLVLAASRWFAHPRIHYAVSQPGPLVAWWEAFVGEAVIMLILMGTDLVVNTSKRLEKAGPFITGAWLCVFVVFESPYSGMSLNPARSLAPAVFSGDYNHLWIYFVAPMGAALLAAEIFLSMRRSVAGWRGKTLPVSPREETFNGNN